MFKYLYVSVSFGNRNIISEKFPVSCFFLILESENWHPISELLVQDKDFVINFYLFRNRPTVFLAECIIFFVCYLECSSSFVTRG